MKIEKIAIGILFSAVIVLFVLMFTNKKAELVYVDSNKLLNNYQGMLDARKEYQNKAQSWKANIDTLAKEVQESIMEYEKESPSMTTKEKELSRELIKTRQQQLADYQKAIQSQASSEDAEMTQNVVNQVNQYLKKFGQKNNYRIILAATDAGNIVYAEEEMDITDIVLEGLNKEYRGE